MFFRRKKEDDPVGERRKVGKDTFIESVDTPPDPNADYEGAYSAIPLKILGNPQECYEKLERVLADVIEKLEDNGVEVPSGEEALKALYRTLQTSLQLEEKKTADRASRQ